MIKPTVFLDLSTYFGENLCHVLPHSSCHLPPCLPCPPAGLPCSCPDRFVPVCASNGRTYPSACVARCLGFKDHQFVFGLCRVSNPCASKPCQRNQRYDQLCSQWVPTHDHEGKARYNPFFFALSPSVWLTARLLFQVAVSVVSRVRGPYQYGVCYSISFTDHQQPPHPPISFDPSLMV